MTLATADASGQPSARIVLLRGADPRGFAFFTNYNSRKGRELEANPHAALCIHWASLDEQIRIEGGSNVCPAEESDAYFMGRPRGSQLGAWASQQSEVLPHAKRSRSATARSKGASKAAGTASAVLGRLQDRPARIEFWYGRPDRLHDRASTRKRRRLDDRAAVSVSFKRALGPFDATMVVIGGIIGSGIFINPYIVAQRLDSSLLVLGAWVAGGAIALAGAYSYAELGALFPRAGGQYVYLRDAYHPLAGLPLRMGAARADRERRDRGRGDHLRQLRAAADRTARRRAPSRSPSRRSSSSRSSITSGVKPGSRVLNVLVVLKVAALGLLIVAGAVAPATEAGGRPRARRRPAARRSRSASAPR